MIYVLCNFQYAPVSPHSCILEKMTAREFGADLSILGDFWDRYYAHYGKKFNTTL